MKIYKKLEIQGLMEHTLKDSESEDAEAHNSTANQSVRKII